jgi:hypothetical protein
MSIHRILRLLLVGSLTNRTAMNARLFLVGACPLAVVACSESEPTEAATESNAGASGQAASGALYVVANEISANEESTSYVTVLSSLDIAEFDSSGGIEFPGGRATMATRAGWVFVAPPTSPEIRRFRVTDAGTLEPHGVVSFLEKTGRSSTCTRSWAGAPCRASTSPVGPINSRRFDSGVRAALPGADRVVSAIGAAAWQPKPGKTRQNQAKPGKRS